VKKRPARAPAQACRTAPDKQRSDRARDRARATRILAYVERETGRISALRRLVLQLAAKRYLLAAGDLEDSVASAQLRALYRQARIAQQRQRLRAL
jgi:hypothetical protein